MDDAKQKMLLRLAGGVTEEDFPLFTCGGCKLDAQKTTNLSFSESGKSKADHTHPDWEPEWIRGNFTAISSCASCSDKAYTVGEYKLYNVDHEAIEYTELFSVKYIIPAVELFKLPIKCPINVELYIKQAAEVIFANPNSAANRIRVSVESLMDELGVPAHADNKKGKSERIDLHKRIEIFKKSNPEIGELLLAVKWIGNDGSHTASVSFSDIVEGLVVYSSALNVLYDDNASVVMEKARAIIKNKGVYKTKNTNLSF